MSKKMYYKGTITYGNGKNVATTPVLRPYFIPEPLVLGKKGVNYN
jgi:hypothetical protein